MLIVDSIDKLIEEFEEHIKTLDDKEQLHPVKQVALSLRYRKEDIEKRLSTSNSTDFTINSTLKYRIHKNQQGQYCLDPAKDITITTPPPKRPDDQCSNNLINSNGIWNTAVFLRKLKKAIKDSTEECDWENPDSWTNYDDIIETQDKYYQSLVAIRKNIIKYDQYFPLFLNKKKLENFNKYKNYEIAESTFDKLESYFYINKALADSLLLICLRLLDHEVYLNKTQLAGPLEKNEKTKIFESLVIQLLVLEKKAELEISASKQSKLKVTWQQLDVFELMREVNFTHLSFNFDDKVLNTVYEWLQTSGFENDYTEDMLNKQRGIIESKPLTLSRVEHFMLLLDTHFTPTKDKNFPFCTIINRAIMAQDPTSLNKLRDIIIEKKSPEAQYSIMAFLITATGLICSALAKLVEHGITQKVTYRDTFLDGPTLETLKQGYITGNSITLPQLLASSTRDEDHQTDNQQKNKTGERASLLFLSPFGGDLGNILFHLSCHRAEQETLIVPTSYIVVAYTYDGRHKFCLRSTWGLENQELSENKNKEHYGFFNKSSAPQDHSNSNNNTDDENNNQGCGRNCSELILG